MCLQSLYRPCGREGDRAYSSYMTYRYDSTLPIYAVRVKTNNETNIINTNLPHFLASYYNSDGAKPAEWQKLETARMLLIPATYF